MTRQEVQQRHTGYLSQFGASGHKVVRISKKLELKVRFRKMRPPKANDAFWIAYQGEWLANILLAEALEGPIRESALKKA